jgi:hypothetical protein
MKKAARQQAVEKQQDECPRRGHHESQRADRRYALTVGKVHQRARADHAAADAHQQSCHGAARIASRHDCFGQQPGQRSKADPDQQVVGPLLEGLR